MHTTLLLMTKGGCEKDNYGIYGNNSGSGDGSSRDNINNDHVKDNDGDDNAGTVD
jgi:hypothetical protein